VPCRDVREGNPNFRIRDRCRSPVARHFGRSGNNPQILSPG
jgi:hypothetical protein